MKIPVFKPANRFLNGIDLPSLVAKIKNSKLAGVATRHIVKFKKDPPCEIYLRGKNPKKISVWQREILEQLLVEKRLASAIAQAMKEYEEWGKVYDDTTKKERQLIREHGIAPFMTISTIVIDEIKKEVILAASTEWDGNLVEHGISIYLRKGRWRFDYADYFIEYQEGFQKRLTKKELVKQRSQVIETMAEEFGSIMEALNGPAKQFEKHFPASGELVKTDAKFLYGDWVFDPRETAGVLKKYGNTKDQIESQIEGMESVHYHFGPNSMKIIRDGDVVSEDVLVGCERRGERASILYKIIGGHSILKTEHWCDGKFLIEQAGHAYRRAS